MDAEARPTQTPLKKAMEYIQAVCERKREEGKTVVYSCQECQDHGLLYFPHVTGTTVWFAFRCTCGAPGDWGAVEWTADGQGKKRPMRFDFRPWNNDIPLWVGFNRKDGQPIRRDELFNLSQRSDYEDRLAGLQPAYTTEPDFLGEA